MTSIIIPQFLLPTKLHICLNLFLTIDKLKIISSHFSFYTRRNTIKKHLVITLHRLKINYSINYIMSLSLYTSFNPTI